MYGGCGGGTDRSGGGPGGGRGVVFIVVGMSRWGMASTFLDSIIGPDGLLTAADAATTDVGE